MIKTTNVNSISFKGKIIDAHVHCGQWKRWVENNGNWNEIVYNYNNDLDTFTKQPLRNGDTVEKLLISNLDCMAHKNNEGEPIKFISDEIKGNEDLLKLAKINPKISALATCQPGYGSVKNIEQLFGQNINSFIGLKFHPEQLNICADSDLYKSYLEFAQNKKLPCLFHSGATFDITYQNGDIAKKSEFARPDQIYTLAKKHPDVPVIMAHMGGNNGKNAEEAINILVESIEKADAKLYADISWVDCETTDKPTIIKVIKDLKTTKKGDLTERLLFGTDAPIGRFGGNGEKNIPPLIAYEQNIENIKTAILKHFPDDADALIDKIFYKNAEELFFKKEWAKSSTDIIKDPIKKTSKTKIGLLLTATTLTLATIITLTKRLQTKTKAGVTLNNSCLMPQLNLNDFIKKVSIQ